MLGQQLNLVPPSMGRVLSDFNPEAGTGSTFLTAN
jgi:hypothetical protein